MEEVNRNKKEFNMMEEINTNIETERSVIWAINEVTGNRL